MTPEAATLVAYLVQHRAKGWMSARDIAKASHWSPRKIRAVAASSNGEVVSGPGGKGYKARKACTKAELMEIAARLRSQAKRMNERAAAILRG